MRMRILRKVGILCLIGLFVASYLYADIELSNDKQQTDKQPKPLTIISGQVVDSVTLEPIVKARVIAKIKDATIQVFTDTSGNYIMYIYSLPWHRLCKIKVSAKGYQPQSKLIFLRPETITVDFNLDDTTTPYLRISTPSEGEEIFPTPTIELNYRDEGSGVDVESVKIYANNRDLSEYIKKISERRAICVVPETAPLGLGPCVISAEVKDLAGNLSQEDVSVTVVSQVEEYITLGKQSLSSEDILIAHEYFSQALDIESYNPEANFYYAITRLAVLPQINPDVFNLFDDMGFTGSLGAPLTPADFDPFTFNAQPPAGFEEFDLVDTFPDGQRIQAIIIDEIILELEGSLENLAVVSEIDGFTSYLEMNTPFTAIEIVEIDQGDVGILKSLIYAIKARMHEMIVCNIDSDFAELSRLFIQGMLTPRYVLEHYPQLLRVKDIPQSLSAKEAFISAIDSYIEGFEFIESETDDQSNDLLSIIPEYEGEANLFAKQIVDIKKSLRSEPDSEFSGQFSQVVNLGYLFNNPFDFRRMLDLDGTSHLLSKYLIPEIDYALTNLSKADVSYQEFLPQDNPFYTGEKKDVDFADVSITKTGLESMRTVVLSMLGYNINLDGEEILLRFIEEDRISINYILASHANFLYLMDALNLDLARDAFGNVVARYMDTIDYLRFNEDFDQSDDLLVPSEYFWVNEHRYARMLLGLDSMQTTEIDPETQVIGDEFHLDLGEFFINYKDLRGFLPQFDEDNHIIPGSWSDPTFGGIFPDGVSEK